MSRLPPSNAVLVGQQFHRAGRLAEAEQQYRLALATRPDDAAALFLLGVLANTVGRLDDAAGWLTRATAADPRHVEAHFLLGVVRHRQRQFAAAVDRYRAALALQPDHVRAANNLGRSLLDGGDAVAAATWLAGVVTRHPAYAGAHLNLGDALRVGGDLSAALAEYRTAIAADPALIPARANLGAALSQLGRGDEAAAVLRQAAALDPKSAPVRYNLAKVLQEAHGFDEAIAQARVAVDLRPAFAEAWNLLGNLLGLTGDVPAGVAAQRRAVGLRPDLPGGPSNLLLSLHYLADAPPAEVFAAHVQWGRGVTKDSPGSLLPGVGFIDDRNPGSKLPGLSGSSSFGPSRPLRVGYVSPDFRRHSVAYFFEPLLAAHDPAAVEVYCYASVDRPDDVTDRLRGRADGWRDIARISDDAAADRVRRDGIDVLVDLAGHTAGNRLGVFARRPAAVQMTYLGYPGTTGLPAIDYRVTDAVADPPGATERFHTERLIRLPGGAWAYRPTTGIPPAPPPATVVTFGSFNNLPKVTPVVLATWARLLAAVPGSRLRIKALGLTAAAGRAYVLGHLAAAGVASDRVEVLPWSGTVADHLRLYAGVDLALDPFPYNGTTTTCEALWAGVPVVTLAGDAHAGRVGASLLTHAGLGELVAASVDDYVSLAVSLATDPSRLGRARDDLRQRLPTAPTADAARLARALEAAYRTAVDGRLR